MYQSMDQAFLGTVLTPTQVLTSFTGDALRGLSYFQ